DDDTQLLIPIAAKRGQQHLPQWKSEDDQQNRNQCAADGRHNPEKTREGGEINAKRQMSYEVGRNQKKRKNAEERIIEWFHRAPKRLPAANRLPKVVAVNEISFRFHECFGHAS